MTNGVMRRKATFLVETEQYKEGLCMMVTPEFDPDGNRNVWTLPDSALQLENLEAYDLVLEGNDDDEYNDDGVLEGNGTVGEWHMATWVVIGLYIVFSAFFFVIWWLLIYPGTCL